MQLMDDLEWASSKSRVIAYGKVLAVAYLSAPVGGGTTVAVKIYDTLPVNSASLIYKPPILMKRD
jgi:hypothetical protein